MQYKYIFIPLITMLLTQVIKFLIETITTKKVNLYRLLNGNGGMPSSHTAFVTSLTTSIGIGVGFDSPVFAASLVFSIIIAYDSMGLRMESGKQAVAINKLMEYNKLNNDIPLKEMLGHRPAEVFIGIIFGIFSAYVQMAIFS